MPRPRTMDHRDGRGDDGGEYMLGPEFTIVQNHPIPNIVKPNMDNILAYRRRLYVHSSYSNRIGARWAHNPKAIGVAYYGVAALGAVLPDLDLIRFYLVDNHQRHHHDYWTHIPAVWVLITLGWSALSKVLKRPFGILPLVFIAGVLSHLCLDTMAGEIEWLWPFFSQGFHLITVLATQAKWYLSFLTHWSFGLEVFVSFISLYMAFSGHGYKDAKDAGAVTGETETGSGA